MYGRAPGPSGDWLDVPQRWFWAYVKMMPRLQAEQAQSRISQISAGNGLIEKSEARQYLDELRRAANQGRGVEKATAQSLGMIGIKVETV